ncbi:hypothetical protein O181_022566 [Austropuccinia psidii MF-1]|uniref:Uncharacterized protein n=1 Tax=Austropuccinia psidii MF-1 TaxID=1389203 RepID=A0A9Q3CD45_9BASI|nr:hypothetical protein [Austropuccinia psidii MF-1]
MIDFSRHLLQADHLSQSNKQSPISGSELNLDNRYPSLNFFKDESLKVILGGVTIGIGGMTMGSLLAIKRNIPLQVPAITMSLKTSAFGISFFALRQFLVNPLIELNSKNINRSPHLRGMLPTGISAVILGGALNGYLRGRSVIARSAFTTSLVCCTLQLAYNELALLRVRLLSSQKISQPEIRSASWWESLIPLKKISDEEWQTRLKLQLNHIDSKKEMVDAEIFQVESAIAQYTKNKP